MSDACSYRCDRCHMPAVSVDGRWQHAEPADAAFCRLVFGASYAESLKAWTERTAGMPRACSWSSCGKTLHAAAGFIEVTHQPAGDLESYCSLECLHWQLHEELR